MTIDEIYCSNEMSIRSYNVCNDNNLKDLDSILQYYIKNKTFKNLRSCGRKSHEELTSICFKYFGNIEYENLNPLQKGSKLISNFTRIQREIVNSFIELNLKNLSNRSKNALNLYLDGIINIRNINEKILSNPEFNINNIKRIGLKSVTELNNFIDYIKEFLEKVSIIDNENDLIALKNRFFIEKNFSISIIPDEIIESQSIFKLINFLFNQSDSNKLSLFNSDNTIVDNEPVWQNTNSNENFSKEEFNVVFGKNIGLIFKRSFKIYNKSNQQTLDEIAEDIGISRERVRQLRKICLEELFNKFQFIINIEDNLFQKYGIDINQDFIKIDDNLKKTINEINGTDFSNEFISYLIYVYLSDKFELIGYVEDVLQHRNVNSRNRHNWNNFYLINKKISSNFDFYSLSDDVSKRLCERIEETYFFNFKSYLSNFLNNDQNIDLSILFPIAEKIINCEFELIIDLNDNISFKRNTGIQVSEYAIEAIKTLGVPCKIEDIFNLIEMEHPDITKSITALRGTLQRTPEIIYFGRSSTYGLKRWEIEKEGIKGGTIKDIVTDYLNDEKNPIHIYEILNEVHKYRSTTNAKNIITNLKLDPKQEFIVFNQSFIGLKRKTYNSNLTNLPKFLGKNITNYIRQHKKINRSIVEKSFANNLKMSEENLRYIVQQLIDSDFIFIDNQNNLYL